MSQAGPPGHAVYIGDSQHRKLALWCAGPPVALFVVSLALISFTSVLDGLAFGPVSWALVVALGQFLIAIVVGHIYTRRAEALEGPIAQSRDGAVHR